MSEILKDLFVPTDGFLDNSINSVKQTLANKFNVDTYAELMNAIKSHVEGTLDFGGYIDISMWSTKMDTLKNFIRGFFYPLMILGAYNYVIWLIRGTKNLGGANG